LEGILFPDRVESGEDLVSEEEYRRIRGVAGDT
jgi:hypothetical protein